jgi:hypothetical protein
MPARWKFADHVFWTLAASPSITRGLATCFPFNLAAASPARTRSRSRSVRTCANLASRPASRDPVAVVTSSASSAARTRRLRCASSSRWRLGRPTSGPNNRAAERVRRRFHGGALQQVAVPVMTRGRALVWRICRGSVCWAIWTSANRPTPNVFAAFRDRSRTSVAFAVFRCATSRCIGLSGPIARYTLSRSE